MPGPCAAACHAQTLALIHANLCTPPRPRARTSPSNCLFHVALGHITPKLAKWVVVKAGLFGSGWVDDCESASTKGVVKRLSTIQACQPPTDPRVRARAPSWVGVCARALVCVCVCVWRAMARAVAITLLNLVCVALRGFVCSSRRLCSWRQRACSTTGARWTANSRRHPSSAAVCRQESRRKA